MTQATDTLLHRWFEQVWNQGNEAAIDSMLAEHAVVHGLADPNGPPIRGPAEFKPFFHQFRTAFPDIHIDVEEAVAQGDIVAVRCVVTATHTGPGLTAAPTRASVHVTGMGFVRIKDGKIVEGWNNFDFLSLYRQLGMNLA